MHYVTVYANRDGLSKPFLDAFRVSWFICLDINTHSSIPFERPCLTLVDDLLVFLAKAKRACGSYIYLNCRSFFPTR